MFPLTGVEAAAGAEKTVDTYVADRVDDDIGTYAAADEDVDASAATDEDEDAGAYASADVDEDAEAYASADVEGFIGAAELTGAAADEESGMTVLAEPEEPEILLAGGGRFLLTVKTGVRTLPASGGPLKFLAVQAS